MLFKRSIISAVSFVMAASALFSCSSGGTSNSELTGSALPTVEVTEPEVSADTYSVVCTIFPEYDWVKEIVGENIDRFDITYLLDNGTDLHNYQPTADDIMKICNCDMFVYVGGESDEWVEDALSEAVNKDMKVINLMDIMGGAAKPEELKEGMDSHEHEHKTDFEESDVKDRSLDEWNGSWQSTYPLLLDGSLDEVWEHKAEDDDSMSADDYKKKYTAAYETDAVMININAPEVEYVTDDKKIKAEYDYSGFYIRTKDDGTKQVRYKFEKKSGDDEAAKYIVFSDHNTEPSEPEHFHLYSGNDGFDTLVEEGVHFPTYYPEAMSADEIVDEMTGGHSHEEEYDEHIWLSLKNAKVLCASIERMIEAVDPENAADYKKNYDTYIEKLNDLDKDLESLTAASSVKTLVFGDRFPFRYFTDDYGLDYYAAFAGCSAESEASFETITFLADKVNELECDTVFTIEKSDKEIAETIIKTSGRKAEIAELDSLQSVTYEDIKNGATYLSLMKKNYDVLKNIMK